MSRLTTSSRQTDLSLLKGNAPSEALSIPRHIAIIMDGNGRWAKHRGLPRLEGHRAGTQNVYRLLEALGDYGVRYVTLFAFSTENWNRPTDEVRGLMAIVQEVIDKETPALHDKNIRLRYLGRMDRLSSELKDAICKALELTKNNTALTLSVAFDYGGRDEIIQAVKQMVREGVPPDQINAEVLEQYLYTRELPDPDLIVRTAGEQRLSNFMIWQSVYSEYYCSPVLWPDFDGEELGQAILAFSRRDRRFGTVAPEE